MLTSKRNYRPTNRTNYLLHTIPRTFYIRMYGTDLRDELERQLELSPTELYWRSQNALVPLELGDDPEFVSHPGILPPTRPLEEEDAPPIRGLRARLRYTSVPRSRSRSR